MNKSKIAVIGGQGYIGNVLCEHLVKKKNKVISIDNRIYNQKIDISFSTRTCWFVTFFILESSV